MIFFVHPKFITADCSHRKRRQQRILHHWFTPVLEWLELCPLRAGSSVLRESLLQPDALSLPCTFIRPADWLARKQALGHVTIVLCLTSIAKSDTFQSKDIRLTGCCKQRKKKENSDMKFKIFKWGNGSKHISNQDYTTTEGLFL